MQFAPGAWKFATPAFLVAALLLVVVPAAGGVVALLGVGVLLFFRDPGRTAPESGFVAPADGKVSVVREEGGRLRVGVFMNVWNVHVNRSPADGVVREVTHREGAHRPAFSKDSDRNERVEIDCGRFAVVLVAGAFARRITPYVERSDRLARGERLGHVAFGSRADVLLPESVARADLLVDEGDRVRAGETVLVGMD